MTNNEIIEAQKKTIRKNEDYIRDQEKFIQDLECEIRKLESEIEELKKKKIELINQNTVSENEPDAKSKELKKLKPDPRVSFIKKMPINPMYQIGDDWFNFDSSEIAACNYRLLNVIAYYFLNKYAPFYKQMTRAHKGLIIDAYLAIIKIDGISYHNYELKIGEKSDSKKFKEIAKKKRKQFVNALGSVK